MYTSNIRRFMRRFHAHAMAGSNLQQRLQVDDDASTRRWRAGKNSCGTAYVEYMRQSYYLFF